MRIASSLFLLVVASPVIASAWAVSGQNPAANAGACDQTTQAASQSCTLTAKSDYWLAVGTCDNLANDTEKTDCQNQAKSDLQTAQSDCQAQTGARTKVCQAVGQAPYGPIIKPEDFKNSTFINNPFLPLKLGTLFIYNVLQKGSKTPQGINKVLVTRKTKNILGIECVVVHDTVTTNGQLVEDTLDYYAQDNSGNVWYFGEAAQQYQDGQIVGLEGSWLAGEDGAKPGIVMKANPQVGDAYRQEFLLGTAEDVAKVIAINQTIKVPYGSFKNTLETEEFSGLEPTALEHKYYVPDIGNVLTVDTVTGEQDQLLKIEESNTN